MWCRGGGGGGGDGNHFLKQTTTSSIFNQRGFGATYIGLGPALGRFGSEVRRAMQESGQNGRLYFVLERFDINRLDSSVYHSESHMELPVHIRQFFMNAIYKPNVCHHKFTPSLVTRYFDILQHALENSFATVIWAETRYIGCGHVEYINEDFHADPTTLQNSYLVCFYGPGIAPAQDEFGNDNPIPSVYETGKPACSNHSTLYPGLCSTEEINFKNSGDPCDNVYFTDHYFDLCDPKTFDNMCEGEGGNYFDLVKTAVFGGTTVTLIIVLVLMWYYWDDIVDFSRNLMDSALIKC
ncbi:uncharacterized protein LOC132193483 [Neocloeon triangulifer]|uniref:uncharacterized protein LOC132193483 n=1 Tax=Neocloeon triangulifer TaxID=2078957 RepID=UPI00286F1775|nr:uncharacterized protein LOC132193483 [Neocloeon triangulifer]